MQKKKSLIIIRYVSISQSACVITSHTKAFEMPRQGLDHSVAVGRWSRLVCYEGEDQNDDEESRGSVFIAAAWLRSPLVGFIAGCDFNREAAVKVSRGCSKDLVFTANRHFMRARCRIRIRQNEVRHASVFIVYFRASPSRGFV